MKISHQNARETRTDTQCSHTVPYATALHTHVTSHTCHGTSQLDLASARVAARYTYNVVTARVDFRRASHRMLDSRRRPLGSRTRVRSRPLGSRRRVRMSLTHARQHRPSPTEAPCVSKMGALMHDDAARKKWTINFALAQNLHARVLPPIEVGCRHGVVAMPPLMTTCSSLAAHRDRVD